MSSNSSGRVLHVTTGLKFGGAETLLLEVLPLTKRRGWDVGLVCLRPGQMIPLFERRGFSPVCLNSRKGDPRAIVQIRREIEAFAPDILHLHLFESEIVASLAALGTSIPQVVTRHNPETFRLSPLIQPFNWFVNGRARYVIAISDAVGHFCCACEGIPTNKVLKIRNAIDLGRFAPPPPDLRRAYRQTRGWEHSLVVGTVGRLTHQKGHRYLLEAWPLVKACYPNAVLILVGSGELQSELEQQCASLGIGDSVQFLGNRWEDLTEILASTDVFVFPSIFEGLGIAVIEAMAMALPVVASKVDGLMELLDESTGVLVPPADPKLLAETLNRLLGNPDERRRLGMEARRFVRSQFDIDNYVNDLLEVYLAVLENRYPRSDLFYQAG